MKGELDDLKFVVHQTSQHIYRACLGILKQRRNHMKFDGVEGKLLLQFLVFSKPSLLFSEQSEAPSSSPQQPS